MSFESVDVLQKTLAERVFHYAADRKKAAGRALGTLVELITYYTLRAWNLSRHAVIERPVPEFAHPAITHNVEFSLHSVKGQHPITLHPLVLPVTPAKIKRHLPFLKDRDCRSVSLLSSDSIKRNACVLADDDKGLVVAHLDEFDPSANTATLSVFDLRPHPFAIFECKRVGVEEGMKKGPQTIEKAKQGAYVARTVSALQKIRLRDGRVEGVLEQPDGTLRTGPYTEILRELIDEAGPAQLQGFILTVGVVSNHGNWFTAEDHNKELRVLAQSYDWLLFLTDRGLTQFIDRLLLNPTPPLAPARTAFLASYSGASRRNQFTKVQIGVSADQALRDYFTHHKAEIESWFNIIAPKDVTLALLQADLRKLAEKNGMEDPHP